MALATPAKVNCMLMKADFLLLASIPPSSPSQHPGIATFFMPPCIFEKRKVQGLLQTSCLDSRRISVPRSGQVTPKGNNRHGTAQAKHKHSNSNISNS